METAVTSDQPKTVVEAARLLNVSRHTLYAWLRQGRLGYVQLGRAIRIPSEEIARVLSVGYHAPRGTLSEK